MLTSPLRHALRKFSRRDICICLSLCLGTLLAVLCVYFLAIKNVAEHHCAYSPVETSNSTLELVHIVFRHGARTPVDTYPNDPYVNDAFYPTGWGHVTNQGKRELYDLGSWLKKRYGNFLAPFYMPDLIHAQATGSPRALMSLSTVLASMFAPHDTPMAWNSALDWQPIPILSEPLKNDSLLLVRTSCPRYFEARNEVLQLPEVRAELSKYESLFRNLTELTGMNVSSADDVNSLYITLQAEQEFGLELPAWTKDYYPAKLKFLAEQSYIYNAYTPEMQKIKGGPFLQKMFAEMQAKQSSELRPKGRRMFIYTGHDWTVGNILRALNVWERQMPRFSIMAMFELHRHVVTKDYFVKIYLVNNENTCPDQLKVPNCGLECPLDKLIDLSHPVLPNEPYEQRCKARNASFVEPPPRAVDQTQAPYS